MALVWRRFGVVVLAAVAAAVVLAGAAAVVPGKNGRIAFTSNRDDPTADLRGNFEIYSMNPDGSGVARLTNNAPGIDGTPGLVAGRQEDRLPHQPRPLRPGSGQDARTTSPSKQIAKNCR